jgi:5-methyltetrahydropteroyltriglutamate--homocysteine methyltransferase
MAPRRARTQVDLLHAPAAIGEVTYRDTGEVEAECALVAGAPFTETFMTAASPGIVAAAMEDRHYPSREAYVRAVAAALATEYHAVVDRGLLLQIDAPDLALERHTLFADRPLAEFLAWVELVVDAVNDALRGIDPAAVRLHVCWGNYAGPHTLDVPLRELLPLLYEARVGALVLSMANPRHAHEHAELERRPPPGDMAVVAGVIDTTTNYVEHPEVVAERLLRVVRAVGDPVRVLAGTDCGFDTSAGIGDVAPSVVWEKLRSLRAGADLAAERL